MSSHSPLSNTSTTGRSGRRAEDDVFPNRLPTSRLGQSHSTLEAFDTAVLHTNFIPTTQTKEYSLIIVTEPSTRPILLGRKHRGFGMDMYNSFGGKLDPTLDKSMEDCAVRELEEETGIALPSPSMLDKVARLHFTFQDSDIKMLVHAYRLNVETTTTTCHNRSITTVVSHDKNRDLYKLDPSVIRGCDEISPHWFNDWNDIPLNNMFADDSVWLTQLLSTPIDDPIFIEGYFHFEAGGQYVNTIRHRFLDIRGKSLERSLFHSLHSNDVSSPSIKEFKEAYAFANAVRSFFGKDSFDVVIDVAGGHGALAALIMLTTSATTAVVIDPAKVGNGGVQKAWGGFLKNKRLTYRYECMRTGLPAVLDHFLEQKIPPTRILVVACHACQHLSDEILQISCAKYSVAAAVMPCCQKDVTPGLPWKDTSKNLDISFATVMDLLLAGKVMSWSILCDVRMKMIDDKITPQNRIILCRPLSSQQLSRVAVDNAHIRLNRAYQRAHQVKKRLNLWHRIDFATLGVGVALGVLFTFAASRR